jgi:CMP-N-acetylneuraminic acid synthetase
LLALIPARGGSKGLPGKVLEPLAGLPLVAHAIACARLCPEVDRIVVSTDSEEVAAVARAHGGDVPFLRPLALARDDTPMWPVVQHALSELDETESVLLLQPTNPGRLPADVARAAALLAEHPEADGVAAVSEPHSNPIWTAMQERNGLLEPVVAEGRRYGRRQDVPRVLFLNGMLYLWRAAFVRESDDQHAARLVPLEVPLLRAVDIDSREDLQVAELLVREGLVELPWLA